MPVAARRALQPVQLRVQQRVHVRLRHRRGGRQLDAAQGRLVLLVRRRRLRTGRGAGRRAPLSGEGGGQGLGELGAADGQREPRAMLSLPAARFDATDCSCEAAEVFHCDSDGGSDDSSARQRARWGQHRADWCCVFEAVGCDDARADGEYESDPWEVLRDRLNDEASDADEAAIAVARDAPQEAEAPRGFWARAFAFVGADGMRASGGAVGRALWG